MAGTVRHAIQCQPMPLPATQGLAVPSQIGQSGLTGRFYLWLTDVIDVTNNRILIDAYFALWDNLARMQEMDFIWK